MFRLCTFAAIFLFPTLNAFGIDRQAQSEDAILDEWIQEQMRERQQYAYYMGDDDLAYATPGHAEDDEFMTAFFSNQDHDAFVDDNNEMDSGTMMEERLDDFFQQKEDSGFVEEEESESMKDVEMENFVNDDQPVFQFFGNEDGDLLTEDFNDFPEDDLFADIQDTGDPDCEQWKRKISQAQAKMNKEGRVVQAVNNATEEEVGSYTADQEKDCSLNCTDVCIPSDAGEECLEMKNGTCVAREPKIDDCSRKMPDPECKAKEDECKGNKRAEAEKMAETDKQQNETHEKLKTVEEEMLNIVKGIPDKCKTMRFRA